MFLFLGTGLQDLVRLEMFTRLVHYFFGENLGKVKIDMRVPVVTAVSEPINVTVMFFLLPFEFQASPPKPTDPEVKIGKVPRSKGCVYVK